MVVVVVVVAARVCVRAGVGVGGGLQSAVSAAQQRLLRFCGALLAVC